MPFVGADPAEGLPDLSGMSLADLAGLAEIADPALDRAIRTVLERRRDSGIVYAGFNAGLTPAVEHVAGHDDPGR